MDQNESELMDNIWVIISWFSRSFDMKTGVGIENNRILTCHHGFGNHRAITARKVREDKTYIMYIEHDDPIQDLSILKFRGNEVPPISRFLNLSHNESLSVGEELRLVGNGEPLVASSFFGRVVNPCIHVDPDGEFETRLVSEEEDRTDIQFIKCFGFEAVTGTSGGPYIRNGEIVGIHISVFTTGFSKGVHVSALKEFVRQADEKERAK